MSIDHRKAAIEMNGRAWDLLETPDRSFAQSEEMINAAHGSLWHWLRAGTGKHHQRGEWMIARCYVDAALPEAADRHLARTKGLTEQHAAELVDYDFAFLIALEARVAALRGDRATADALRRRAAEMGAALADAGDRDEFMRQLNAGPWFALA